MADLDLKPLLVDRNALIEKIREGYCYNCIRFKDMDCDGCNKAEIIYTIEDMPVLTRRGKNEN